MRIFKNDQIRAGFFLGGGCWGGALRRNNYALQTLKVLGAMKVLGPKKVCPFVSNLEIFYIYYHLAPSLFDCEF